MEDGHVAKKRKVGMTSPNVMVTSEPSGMMPYRPINGNLGPPSVMISGQNGRMPSTPNWAMNPNRDSLPVNMMHGANPRHMGHIPQHLPMHSVSANGQQSFRGCSPSKAHLPNGTPCPDNVAHFASNSGVPSPYQTSNMMMMRPPGQPTMQPYMTNMQPNVVPNQRAPFNLHSTGINGNQTLYNGSGMNVNGPAMNINGPGMNVNNGPGMNLNGPGMNLSGPGMNLNGPGMNLNGPGMNLNGPGMNLNGPGMNLNGPGMNVNGPGIGPGVNLNGPGMNPGMNLNVLNNIPLQQNQSQFNELTSNGAHFQMNGDLNGANLMQNSNVVGGNQDPEKRKLIQQQLVLLLHAHKCQQRERTVSNGYQNACTLAHCQTMKNVLNHMLTCREGLMCSVPHCASSRQIISHWKQCQQQACAVCLPLRQWNDKKQNATNSSTNCNNFSTESSSNGFIGDAHTAHFPSASQPNVQNRPNSDQAALGLSENGYPLSNGSSESVFAPSSFSQIIPAEETSSVKDWQKQITLDLRNHLVSKLVKAIFPTPDPSAFQDRRLQDLINYARKVEREMFDSAENREEYYHLLAEKIYKIQKELSDKKQKRLEEAAEEAQSKSSDPSLQWQTSMSGSLKDLDSTIPPNRVAPIECSNSNSSSTKINTIKQEIKVESYSQSNGACQDSEPKTFSESIVVKTEEIRELKSVKKETEFASETSTSHSVCDVKMSTKIFSVDEMRSLLLPVWEKLYSVEESLFFREPVDPEQLFIPDYFKIVKKPMDLSTIRTKLFNGDYKDPWQFCEDIWLMFDNAWLYNRKNSKVYKFCSKLSEMFTDLIEPVMKSFGLCCGKKRSFTPLALVCYGQAMCSIPRDAPYYYYETKPQFGVAPDRYTYCKKCFDEMSGDSICLSDDPTSASNCIRKSEFNLFKNDMIEYEPFVACVDCGRKWHQICALHLDSINHGGFVCEVCLNAKNKKRAENRFTAKRLPTCKLSNHLENRVNNYLRSKEPSTNVEVIIRVLASSDKEVEVKPLMKAKYCSSDGMPDKFPYRTKAIFAFEVIDGVEVCFFGLHVQEYGDKSLPPNSRRVYIAYLDSVHFFQPKEHRTAVYHELLLAYLEYCKALGYTKAHIWACPPSEGDDYIFHCHPLEQKIPKPKRLQEWYKKLLDQGIIERTVVDYKDIHRQAQDDNVQSVAELPYFEGDYWPNVIEESIKESDNDEALRRREAEAQMVVVENAFEDFEDEVDDFPASKSKKPSKGQKKHKQKTKGTSSKKSKKSSGAYGNGIIDKVFIAMEKHKEVFFVVQLHSSHAAANLGPINDPDPLLSCELMESRDTFLSTARERHWEFSSLRRAKWSTLGLCYELHTQGQEKFLYNCDSCQSVNAQWHCTVCEDYDLCQKCFDKINHQHKMEPLKISHDADGGASNGAVAQRNSAQATQRALLNLPHACQCRNANCKIGVCAILRRYIAHNKECKKKDNCETCKKFLSLCCQHAKQCQERNCVVVYCSTIKQKLAEQEAKKKKKQALEMYRRINQMGKQMSSMASSSASTNHEPDAKSFSSPKQCSPAMSSSSAASPAFVSGPMSNNSNYPPNVPQGAVLAAKEIERVAALSSRYPDYAPAGRMPISNMNIGGMTPNRMAMWNESSMSVTAPPNFTVHPRMCNDAFDSTMMHQQHPSAGGVAQGQQTKLHLQQKVHTLLQALKMAKSEEEKKQFMDTLRSDPQLFQAFIAVKQQPSNNQRQQQMMKANGNGVNTLQQQQSLMNNMQLPPSVDHGNFYQHGYGQQSTSVMHGGPASTSSLNQMNAGRMPPNYGNGSDFTHVSPNLNASPNDGTGVYYQNPVGNYVPNQEFDFASSSQPSPNVVGHHHLVNAQQQQQQNGNVYGPDFYSIRR